MGIPEIRTPRSDCPKACYDFRSWCLSGRIDRVAVHLNGIAVDHRGRTGHVGQGWGGEQAEGDGEGAHGYSLPHPAAQVGLSRPGRTE